MPDFWGVTATFAGRENDLFTASPIYTSTYDGNYCNWMGKRILADNFDIEMNCEKVHDQLEHDPQDEIFWPGDNKILIVGPGFSEHMTNISRNNKHSVVDWGVYLNSWTYYKGFHLISLSEPMIYAYQKFMFAAAELVFVCEVQGLVSPGECTRTKSVLDSATHIMLSACLDDTPLLNAVAYRVILHELCKQKDKIEKTMAIYQPMLSSILRLTPEQVKVVITNKKEELSKPWKHTRKKIEV